MKSDELHSQARHLLQQLACSFTVDAELLRTSAHLHTRGFEFEVGVYSKSHAWRAPQAFADCGDAMQFSSRLHIQSNPTGHRADQLGLGLSRACKTDRAWISTCIQRNTQLVTGSDVQTVYQWQDMLHQCTHRVRFDGVMNMQFRW
jgi:hypothetical protein